METVTQNTIKLPEKQEGGSGGVRRMKVFFFEVKVRASKHNFRSLALALDCIDFCRSRLFFFRFWFLLPLQDDDDMSTLEDLKNTPVRES